MSVLSVQSVSYSYKTKYQTVQAVKDVSCDLSAGTFYALVGKSGSGKTTLLHYWQDWIRRRAET